MPTRLSRIGTIRKVGECIRERERNTKNQIPHENLARNSIWSFTLDIDDDKLTINNSDDFSGDEGEV